MFKAEYIVYLCIYINITCICNYNTVRHLQFNTEGKSLIMKVGPGL